MSDYPGHWTQLVTVTRSSSLGERRPGTGAMELAADGAMEHPAAQQQPSHYTSQHTTAMVSPGPLQPGPALHCTPPSWPDTGYLGIFISRYLDTGVTAVDMELVDNLWFVIIVPQTSVGIPLPGAWCWWRPGQGWPSAPCQYTAYLL